MFPVFALIFLVVPLVEIYILIQVGQIIGALWTIFFVVFTAVIGVQLLKHQGLSTLMRAQQKLSGGEMPAQELLEGFALVIAGAFLLTPGFFTDAFGFLLLIPATRRILIKKITERMIKSGSYSMHAEYHAERREQPGNIIEGVKYHADDEHINGDNK